MRDLPRLIRAVLVPLAVVFSMLAMDGASSSLLIGVAEAQPGACGLSQAAFCDTFDQPAGTGTRSGQLNGTVWGVSRQLGGNNFGQGQYDAAVPTQLQTCGGTTTALPPNDVIICNGRLREATNDGGGANREGGVTSLAMYPKQPFDFAGRTGIVTFDVSNDSPGIHTTWPEFWITDQPIPDPFTHFGSWLSVPRNGFGIRLADGGGCGGGPNQWTVDSAIVVRNYVIDGSKGPGEPPAPGAVTATSLDCVLGPGAMAAALNHVEVHVSQNQIDVYATDAGTLAPLHHIAVVQNVNLSFTRGLIWLEDVHYNAHKFGGPPEHTYAWDNVGFDGPVLARDLGFDVLDALVPVPNNQGQINLGWAEGPNEVIPQIIAGVSGIQNAQAALLTFNFYYLDQAPPTLNYVVNGHTHSVGWPYPDTTAPQGGTIKTLAVPVPLADVVTGTNIVSVSSDQALVYSNMDLILVGAAGGGCVCPPASSTSTATPTPTNSAPTPTPSNSSPTPTPTSSPTPVAVGTETATPTSISATFTPTSAPPPAPAPPASGTGGGGGGGGGATVRAAPNITTSSLVPPPPPPSTGQQSVARQEPAMLALPDTSAAAAPAQLLRAAIDANGGQLGNDQLSLTVPSDIVGPAGGELNVLLLDPSSVPGPAAGFGRGTSAFVITLTDPSTGRQTSQPSSPLTLEYRPSLLEINSAGGDLSRLKVAIWSNDAWVALPCSTSDAILDCPVTHLSLFTVIVAPSPSETPDMALDNGWFYKQTNGFNGAGEAGFAVVDDADAEFWTEFQRLGGVERLGYPISKRFQYGGYSTQVFQKLVLQWRPEVGQAIPFDVFDDLGMRRIDGWLEKMHQVPSAADAADEDLGLPWNDLVARHVARLDAYPALLDFYANDPDALARYGLPLTVKEYGPLVSVRLQRAVLRMSTTDAPWATAGTVVVGAAGDFTKEAGLWPADAVAPSILPPNASRPQHSPI